MFSLPNAFPSCLVVLKRHILLAESKSMRMGVIDIQHITTETCTLLTFSVMGVDMLSYCSCDLQSTLSSWLLRI